MWFWYNALNVKNLKGFKNDFENFRKVIWKILREKIKFLYIHVLLPLKE